MTKSVKVNFKKLNKKAIIPTKAHPTDAGFDMVAVTKTVTDKYIEYGTGIAVAIPDGHVGLLFANSRVSKYDLDLANAVGVVDQNFRGEVRFRYKHTVVPQTAYVAHKTKLFNVVKDIEPCPITFMPREFNVGDIIGQMIIMPIPAVEFIEVNELDETDRGEGGFGSTEKQNIVEVPTETPKKKRSRKKKNE